MAVTISPPDARSLVRWAQTQVPWTHDLRWRTQRWVYRRLGRPHEDEFLALADLVPSDAVCVDGGANRGQSIESIRTVLGLDAYIYAFEPQEGLASALQSRYAGVRVFNCGLGAQRDWITLYVPSYGGCRFDALACSDPADAVEWFKYSIWRYDPTKVSLSEEKVQIDTLDGLALSGVDFIKLDVQGMELAALRGGIETISAYRPVLMLETPDQDTHDFLAKLGYQARYWVNGRIAAVPDGFAVNTLFLPR